MALPVIVLTNNTVSDIDLIQFSRTIPASSSITISETELTYEILNDVELQGFIDAGSIEATIDGVVLTVEQTKAQLVPRHALDIKHNFTAVVDPDPTTDDAGAGYSVGSNWVNLATGMQFQCMDATVGAAIWSVGAGGTGGDTMLWGGKLTSPGKFAKFNGIASGSSASSLNFDSEGTAPASGRIGSFTWNTQSADVTTVWNIFVDDIIVETITATGVRGNKTLLSAALIAGTSLVAVQFDSGTDPDRGTYYIGITAGVQ